MDPTHWTDVVRPVVAGRKIVLTGSPVAGQAGLVAQVRSLGATDVFVLGDGMGTGTLPECDWYALEVKGDSLLEAMRHGQALLADLPPAAAAALDAFDPGREALVIGTFLNELPAVAGRPCLAWRRPEWVALEDKVIVDELWDALGVERVASRVVPVAELPDDEPGTVWAGDAREGFNGGAELVRPIRNAADAAAARSFLAAHCDRARVMPFLEGIPCSIHGFVFPDYVAALRPVEMVTLRRGGEFFYAGAATYWDPPAADRDTMRAIARRVGAELRQRVDFRGAFTVDGVLTSDGFRPTELNPRMGAGLGVIARGAPDLPLDLVNQSLLAGIDADYRPRDLETHIVEVADACRAGGTWKVLDAPLDQATLEVTWDGTDWRKTADGATADATVMTGPSSVGGFLRLTLDPARTPAGPSIAPRAAAFYRFCDAELGTEIGPLDHAIEARA
jgi:hypothetical protein